MLHTVWYVIRVFPFLENSEWKVLIKTPQGSDTVWFPVHLSFIRLSLSLNSFSTSAVVYSMFCFLFKKGQKMHLHGNERPVNTFLSGASSDFPEPRDLNSCPVRANKLSKNTHEYLFPSPQTRNWVTVETLRVRRRYFILSTAVKPRHLFLKRHVALEDSLSDNVTLFHAYTPPDPEHTLSPISVQFWCFSVTEFVVGSGFICVC